MDQSSDMEKLFKAFEELRATFGSFDSILEAFGLLHMPTAQRYGIMFGFLTFICTVFAVLCLLTFGGSFQRIAEQQKGDATIPHAHMARAERALLLERLIDARERMLQYYPPAPTVTNGLSNLTKMLQNDHSTDVMVSGKEEKKEAENFVREFPEGFEHNYEVAYRKCQDAPGGPALSGRPEARFEAYARAYAGCGNYTNLSYRRSYARMHEAISCQNHDTDDKYTNLFKDRPQDIIGKNVRLEALEEVRHLDVLFELTSGAADTESLSFDPEVVYGFLEDGPFKNKEEMRKSFIFQRKINEAAFVIVNNISDKVVGAVLLTNDNPQHLSIQLEAPIMRPTLDGSQEQLEACYLLLDRLFALGYRRIQMSCDAQDSPCRKLAVRLAFTLEGTLFKHMVVKDANRDSTIYGLLNSDWDRGARFALFKKLYGKAAAQSDHNRRKKEEETDEQNRVLAEQKAAEEAAKDKKL